MKSIPYSILELAVVTEDGNPSVSFERSVELAQKAEDLGYTRFWLAEHHNMISVASAATVVLIGHIAGQTKRIRVGSGGIMLPNHAPFIVAEQFGTLGNLYQNRIDMGLGRAPGTDQATAEAIRPGRMQAVFQFPEDIRQIQQYFSPANKAARVRVPLAEGVQVPIYILGSSTDSAHLAARLGLPYAFASHFAGAQLMEALAIYRREFQPSEQLKAPYTIACINALVAETDDDANRISTSHLRMIVGIISGQLQYLPAPVPYTQEFAEIKEHPAMQSFLKYSFSGSKATVRKAVEDFVEKTGVSELMISCSTYDQADRLYSYEQMADIMQTLGQS